MSNLLELFQIWNGRRRARQGPDGATLTEPVYFPNSSNVGSIQYDASSQELYVTFKNGSTYVYESVPPAFFRVMSSSASPGRFVHRLLRDRFVYRRLS